MHLINLLKSFSMRGSSLGKSMTSSTSNSSVKKKVWLKDYFLDIVTVRPVLEQTLHQGDSQTAVLGQEKHTTTHQLFVEKMASLHLVQRDNHGVKKSHVFFSQRYSEARNNTKVKIEIGINLVSIYILI